MNFDDEFDELAALAYQTAFRILGSRHEAEEVAQDTMTKAYVRWRTVQRHARPWICRVAVNGSLGIVRRRRRNQHVNEPHAGFQTAVADRVDLQRLLSSLSGRQRDVVALRYLADLSELEVADELGISVGSVKTHAHRGIATLRQHLDSGSPLAADVGSEVVTRKEPTDV
jgi:RNA polymerase sigma factor (sigma-70 family)